MFDKSTLQDAEVLAILQAVLAGIRDHDDIEDAFDAVDDGEDLADLLGGYDALMLYATSDSSPAVLLQLLHDSWPHVPPSTPVRVIRHDGSSDLATVGNLSAQSDLCFEPGAVVVASDIYEVDELPFAADAGSWEQTKASRATGETDWVIRSNGEEIEFNLSEVRRNASPVSEAWPGIWFEVQCDGESMSTGEIGITIWSDANGEFWAETWGATLLYLGQSSRYRPDNAKEVLTDALDVLDTELWDIASISSGVLTSDKICPSVFHLAKCDQNMGDRDLERVSVTCVDFDYTVRLPFDLMDIM